MNRESRWGTVPGSPEEARAFLQRRIAIALGKAALLWGVGAALAIPLAFISRPQDASGGVNTARNLTHIGMTVALLVMWLITRRGRLSLSLLSAIDFVGALLQACLLSVMIATSLPIIMFRPDLSMILGLTYVLLTRAVIVPSTTRTTALIGVLACIPVLAATHYVYSLAQAEGLAPHLFSPGSPWTFVAWGSVFCVLSTIASVMVSSVIYGLSRAVQRARQLGQYTLEEKIGEGGMGVVYRGRHALLRRPTAIKLLPAERAGEDTVARFEREVQVTSQLTHPNTVAIYDYGRTPEDVFYYAMEYLDGVDLEVLVERDGPQPPGRVRRFLRQIAGALAEAHARGLIHRDIKPSNVVVCERGLIPERDVHASPDLALKDHATREGVGAAGVAADEGAACHGHRRRAQRKPIVSMRSRPLAGQGPVAQNGSR